LPISEYIRPTDLADYEYCPRYFYINKIHPHNGKKTEKTVLGLFEHAVFEKYFDLTKLDWLDAGVVNGNEKDSLRSRVALILDVELKIAKENFGLFSDCLEKDVLPLKLRLAELNEQKLSQLKMLIKKKIPLEQALNIVLPWKIEQWMQSEKYGIRGIADAIYQTENGGLIVQDIKSHDDRFDAYIHKTAHFAQGATYAILAEERYGMPVKKFQIFYSKDLTTETLKITKKTKLKVLNAIDESKQVLANGLPPKLEGDAAVRCQNCYKRDFCFSLDKKSKSMELLA